ncbi:MAG TPA: hypothetical protein PLD84_09240, partial [Chitinophagales bacterium]|nr:hypothetical protein [Chitinophagales bacterium]
MKSKFTLLSLAIVLCPVFSSFAQSPAWDWAASTSSNSSFFPKEITVDASGNSYVCGYFSNTLTIGSTVLTSNGGNDLYYAKYDAAGNAVWAKNAGSANNDQATAIVSDRAGDLYMCGIFSGTITLGSTSLTAFGLTSQPFISKLDENGNFIWAISGNGNFSGTARTLTVDASGNIYVVGDYAAASFTIAGFTLTNNDPGPGDENLFFVKLDPNGTGIYAKEAGGPKREYGNAIAVNNSGEVFITGQFFSKTLNFGNGVKLTNSLYGFSDFYLAKFDAAGNILWAKSSGGDLNEEGLYLAADASGNCYVEGRFNSATSTLSPVTLTNNGSTNFLDIFFAKYNAAGNLLWAQNIGGTGDEQPSGIAVSPTGGICFSGSYTSASLTLGTNTLTNNGSADVFAGGLDVNGTVRWATNIGGTQTDNITGFEVDENENIYLNGSYNSPSVSFGSITLTSGGTNNEFVAKLNPNITANAIATGAIAPLTYLAGDAVSVSFVVSGGFGAGNTFTAELSNASGSFTAPVAIGSLAATTSGTISATIP